MWGGIWAGWYVVSSGGVCGGGRGGGGAAAEAGGSKVDERKRKIRSPFTIYSRTTVPWSHSIRQGYWSRGTTVLSILHEMLLTHH